MAGRKERGGESGMSFWLTFSCVGSGSGDEVGAGMRLGGRMSVGRFLGEEGMRCFVSRAVSGSWVKSSVPPRGLFVISRSTVSTCFHSVLIMSQGRSMASPNLDAPNIDFLITHPERLTTCSSCP